MTKEYERKGVDRRAPVEASRHDEPGNWFVKAGTLTRSIKFVLSIFALLLAASLLFQFTATRNDSARTQALLEQGFDQRAAIQDQADLIIDCTSPGGECFKRGQESTAEVVAGLNIVTQYSVICGERVDGEEAILNCVNDEVQDYLRIQELQQDKNKNN